LKGFFTILVCSIAILGSLEAQTVYYYGVNSRPLANAENALTKKELIEKSESRFIIKTSVRSEDEKKADEWLFKDREKIRIENNGTMYIKEKGELYLSKKTYRQISQGEPGVYHFSESDGARVLRTGFSSRYLPLLLEGAITEYHSNGNVKSISQYSDNQLISNQNWLRNGDRYIDSIFYSADQEPEYKMGPEFFHKYLLQNLYNSDIDLTQIQDVVELGWVVMENGKMDGIITLSGRSLQLNQFIVNTVTEMPGDWQPAMLDGRAVRYFISVPLNFQQLEISFQELELSSGTLHYNRY